MGVRAIGTRAELLEVIRGGTGYLYNAFPSKQRSDCHTALCGCALVETDRTARGDVPRHHVESVCEARYPAVDESQEGWEATVRERATEGLLRDVIRTMD